MVSTPAGLIPGEIIKLVLDWTIQQQQQQQQKTKRDSNQSRVGHSVENEIKLRWKGNETRRKLNWVRGGKREGAYLIMMDQSPCGRAWIWLDGLYILVRSFSTGPFLINVKRTVQLSQNLFLVPNIKI